MLGIVPRTVRVGALRRVDGVRIQGNQYIGKDWDWQADSVPNAQSRCAEVTRFDTCSNTV